MEREAVQEVPGAEGREREGGEGGGEGARERERKGGREQEENTSFGGRVVSELCVCECVCL
jgi:hypothetical protein